MTFFSTAANGGGGFIKQVHPVFQIGTAADTQSIALLPGGKTALFAEGEFGNISIGSADNPLGRLHVFHEKRGLLLQNSVSGYFWEWHVNRDNDQLELYNSDSGAVASGRFRGKMVCICLLTAG
jgi:hypothetical protein